MNSQSASHVLFVPFVLRQQGNSVILGHADGKEYHEFETPGGTIICHLDRGSTIEEVQHIMVTTGYSHVNVSQFVQDLQHLGYVSMVAPMDTYPGSNHIKFFLNNSRWSYFWPLFFCSACLGVFFILWALLFHRVQLPPVSRLLISYLPFWLAILLLAGLDIILNVLHELSHLVVARWYGLRPTITLGRRGVWFVAQTVLTGIWLLDRRIRWRPILAGILCDTLFLALAILIIQHTAEDSLLHAFGQCTMLLLLARLLWQCQWYLRTDLYFLWAVFTGVVNLKQVAWQFLSKHGRKIELPQYSVQDQRAGAIYLCSLPFAAGATLLLCFKVILPLFLEIIRGLF